MEKWSKKDKYDLEHILDKDIYHHFVISVIKFQGGIVNLVNWSQIDGQIDR